MNVRIRPFTHKSPNIHILWFDKDLLLFLLVFAARLHAFREFVPMLSKKYKRGAKTQ